MAMKKIKEIQCQWYNIITDIGKRMNTKETREYVNNQLCAKLKAYVDDLYGIIIYGDYYSVDDAEKFALLRKISILFNELLGDKDNKLSFNELLSNTVVDKEQFEAKSSTFSMIRHLLVHFPIFETWDSIFITKNLLNWNNGNRKGAIERYFSKYSGKTLKFSIYTRVDYHFDKTRDFDIPVPQIHNSKQCYIKDFLSLDDALWLFSLVGYFLEWKSWKIDPNEKYLGMISA